MRKVILLLSLIGCMLLWGACQSNPVVNHSTQNEQMSAPDQTESQEVHTPENTTPTEPIRYGTLITAPLELTVTEDFRCDQTSGGWMYETEQGFYTVQNTVLYYADKSDLSLWVPVCTKPDCAHRDHDTKCDAHTPMEFMVRDGRIYKNGFPGDHGEIMTLVSTAMDGTDKRLELTIPEAEEMMAKGAWSCRMVVWKDYMACYASAMNLQGNYDMRIYTADQNGLVLQTATEADSTAGGMRPADIGGGEWFVSRAIDVVSGNADKRMIYTVQEGELVSLEITGLPTRGAWFDGKEMRFFQPNDGYYHVDIDTRERTKLSEPKLENSGAAVALPNCIIESTLMGQDSLDLETAQQEMWLFNGEQWLSVALPEEIQNIGPPQYFDETIAVATDRVLLRLMTEKNYDTARLYQILLNTDAPTLEYLGTIGTIG